LLEAIEVGNEANTFSVPDPAKKCAGETFSQFWARKNPWSMTSREFADLITYAHVWIENYRSSACLEEDCPGPLIEGPVQVVSGGLFAKFQRQSPLFSNGLPPYPTTQVDPMSWKQYLTSFQSHTCADYDIGFHPYDLGPYDQNPPLTTGGSPVSESPRGSFTSENVLELFDEASALTNRDIWVTETGATSRENTKAAGPVLESTQASELYAMTWGLASRSRCKAMIVHRLYDSSHTDSESPTNAYYRFGVFKDTEVPPQIHPNKTFSEKTAFGSLRDAWDIL